MTAIQSLPELAPWLTNEKLAEVESVVRDIPTQFTTIFSESNRKTLKTVAGIAADMQPDEMYHFFSHLIENAAVLRQPTGASILFLRTLSAITPLISAVPVLGHSPEYVEALKIQNVLIAMSSSMGRKASLTVPRVCWRLLTRSYDTLLPNEQDMARGYYLREVTNRQIAEADVEWFGHHWEEIVPLMGRLASADSYSRGYVEELLANRDITGTTLLDGVL